MPMLDDWTVKLKFDSSEVDKGISALDKKFDRLGKKAERALGKAQRASSSGVRGSSAAPRTNLQRLTSTGRLGLEQKILKAETKARDALAKLEGRNDKNSLTLKAQLESQIKRLNAASKDLGDVTFRNSPAFERLQRNLQNTTNAINRTAQSTGKLTRQFNAQKFAVNGLTSSLQNMARSYLSIFAVVGAGAGGLSIGRGFEDMAATLLLTSGNAEAAGKDLEFLTMMSERLGLALLDTSKSFSKFGVAGRSAGLTDGEMKKAFEDMAVTIRATGLTQDKANLSFLALQQMLSNGVVSMQELKLQLSEQLPQTMAVAEQALRNLGHTSGSVKDIISTGTVESGTFVKELTRIMKEQAVESGAYEAALKSVTSQMGRLGTATDIAVKGFFDAGGRRGISDFFKGLTSFVKSLNPSFRALGKIFGPILSMFGEFLDIISQITVPAKILAEVVVDISSAFLSAATETEALNGQLTLTQRLLRGIAGIINVVIGSFEVLGNKYEQLRGDLKFDSPSGVVESIDRLVSGTAESLLDQAFGRDFLRGGGSRQTTITMGDLVVQAPEGSDTQSIAEQASQEVSQAILKAAQESF